MMATTAEIFEAAVRQHQAGHLAEAEDLYREILAREPKHAGALHLLGVVAHQLGRHELAVEWISQAIALTPGYAGAYANLGVALTELGRYDEAVTACRQAIALQPDAAEAYVTLGTSLQQLGQLEEANKSIRHALALQPEYAEAYHALGILLQECGPLDEAAENLRRAVALKPDFAAAGNNLAVVLKQQGHLDEAIEIDRRLLRLDPNLVEAHSNLGNALKERGDLDGALAAFRHALEIKPDHPGVRANLVVTLLYHPDSDPASVREEHERWNRLFWEPERATVLPHENSCDPQRRLRIGYVSPDFREHPVAFFLAPLLEAHDHEQFEIFGYASVARPDAITGRLRRSVDVWREVRYLSDAALAARIREDRIDLLVDLAMHTAGNRLLVFARKPAPLQVSWLAYPGSTGLAAIDYRLSDRWIDPPEAQPCPSPPPADGEVVVRLPDAWCCYAPILDFPPVSPLPAAQGQPVTFGSFNQFGKLNTALLRTWARLLAQVAGARLLLIVPCGEAMEGTIGQLAQEGIAQERLELVAPCPWEQYVELFAKVDLALDSYPCNGMTTTCHALWMGVPVVSRAGQSAVSRAGWSLLSTLGLPELVAQGEEDYVRIAVQLAGDLARLGQLRAGLRERMRTSPLMDAPRFARNIEAAYRAMWHQWCQQQAAP